MSNSVDWSSARCVGPTSISAAELGWVQNALPDVTG